MTLAELDEADHAVVRNALLACCGSSRWADALLLRRPFGDLSCLHQHAETVWWSLEKADWLEAFAKHPKIGQKSTSEWSSQEQQGMSQANQETAGTIRDLNQHYFDRFGYIFIICATGRTALEIRDQLELRLNNQPSDELRIAAAEQAKIMHLRLDKLLAS